MAMQPVSAPVFFEGGHTQLGADDSHVRAGVAGTSFVLSGPGATAMAGHLPVRGDLAHINLAGRYFVPHYAVPMPMTVSAAGTVLRAGANEDAAEIEVLAAGACFNVLDIAGRWAWGQVGDDGFVGYVLTGALEGFRQ